MEASNLTKGIYWQEDGDDCVFAEDEWKYYLLMVRRSATTNRWYWEVAGHNGINWLPRNKLLATGWAPTMDAAKWECVKGMRKHLVNMEIVRGEAGY